MNFYGGAMARQFNGWIRIERKLAISDIAQRSPETLKVWMLLLCMANQDESKEYLAGIKKKIQRGQLVSGVSELAKLAFTTEAKVKSALKYLKMTGRITDETTTKGRVITITKWDQYQYDHRQNSHQVADKSPTDDFQIADGSLSNSFQVAPSEQRNNITKKQSNQDTGTSTDQESMPLFEAEQKIKPIVSLPRLACLWNEHCGKLAKVKSSNPTRDKKIKAIWSRQSEAEWVETIKRMAASDFCNGVGSRNGWKATFDFLLQPETYLKVSEGKYDGKNKQSTVVNFGHQRNQSEEDLRKELGL
jgi:hypothetical protein